MHDSMCRLIVRGNSNMLIPWFLMSSYAYDVLDTSIISDALYDSLSREMFEKFHDLHHVHKNYIKYVLGETKGSSLCVDMSNLPTIVKDTAVKLISSM